MDQTLFVILTITFISSVLSFCPNGWIRYEDSCYLFEDIKEDWNTSRLYCQGFNADLAIPETAQENSFIKGHLTKIYKDCDRRQGYYWFGMKDEGHEGEWVWATGELVTYTDWAPNEPSNNKNGNCGAYFGSLSFKWDDFACSAKRLFICEYKDQSLSIIVGKK